jgi:hypothetical protein
VEPSPDTPSRPPRLAVVSGALGALGLLLFAIGAIAGSTPVFVAGFLAGAASLGVALYWRSELVTEWHERKGDRRTPTDL